MKQIPKSTRILFNRFINHFPESFHQTDIDLFYMFVYKLLSIPNLDFTPGDLEGNLKKECKKLSNKQVERYGDMYSTIKEFKTAPKRHTWKLIAEGELKQKGILK